MHCWTKCVCVCARARVHTQCYIYCSHPICDQVPQMLLKKTIEAPVQSGMPVAAVNGKDYNHAARRSLATRKLCHHIWGDLHLSFLTDIHQINGSLHRHLDNMKFKISHWWQDNPPTSNVIHLIHWDGNLDMPNEVRNVGVYRALPSIWYWSNKYTHLWQV